MEFEPIEPFDLKVGDTIVFNGHEVYVNAFYIDNRGRTIVIQYDDLANNRQPAIVLLSGEVHRLK